MKLISFLIALACSTLASGQGPNSTSYWLGRRAALIDSIFGYGQGVLSEKSVPDQIITWPEEPSIQGLVWDMSTLFPITSTVIFSPAKVGERSERAFFFHHGHSDCVCPTAPGASPVLAARCRPGCQSIPYPAEAGGAGYSWWDLYNVSSFLHDLGYDVFIFSMPLKGINLGPGSTEESMNTNHWWFLQWEQKGDHALRYFVEPVVLTANYAAAQGYRAIHMSGLSGGGWSATLAPAIDPRIAASFPIAGSLPCEMRNPVGVEPNQSWTGNDQEDFEQSCMPVEHPVGLGDDKPGRAAFAACNYTCMYLLAGLEPGRFQVQILHEYDNCCFSPHARHEQMLAYEASIRSELMASDRNSSGPHFRHGWFTSTASNHVMHEVCPQDKIIIAAALADAYSPGSWAWDALPCDILHHPIAVPGCPLDEEPALPPHVPSVEDRYALLGHGVCSDLEGRKPAWGRPAPRRLDPTTNAECATLCAAEEACDAYASLDWSPMTVHSWMAATTCTFYCSRGVGGPCTEPGDQGGMPSGVIDEDPLLFCWLKLPPPALGGEAAAMSPISI